MVWIILIMACLAGVYWGGGQSLRLARRGDFDQALVAERTGGLCAAGMAMLGAFVFLGWPFCDEQVSVPEEIARTIVETVEVPVAVPRWIFWTRTEMKATTQERTVVETIFHSRSVRHFSIILAAALGLIGGLAYFAHRGCLRVWWTLRG